MGLKESKETENLPATLTGLYNSCKWEQKNIRKFIYTKKLAPIFVGKESEDSDDLEECPICFLSYPAGLNRFNCCKKGVCTECFLQISIPNTSQVNSCPFCNHTNSIISYTGPKSAEEKANEAQEKQKVLELQIKIRNEEIENDKQRRASFPTSSTSSSNNRLSITSSSVPSSIHSSPLSPSIQQQSTSTNFGRRAKQKTSPYLSEWDEIEELFPKHALELSSQQLIEQYGSQTSSLTAKTKSTEEETNSSFGSNEETDEDLELALAISLSLQK